MGKVGVKFILDANLEFDYWSNKFDWMGRIKKEFTKYILFYLNNIII